MTKALKNKKAYEVYASRFEGYAEDEAVALVDMLEKMLEKGLRRGTVSETRELIASI